MYEVTIETIDFMPLLKQQIKQLIRINYEEAANYSNESLVREYHYLNNNNLLGQLKDVEYLINGLGLKLNYNNDYICS